MNWTGEEKFDCYCGRPAFVKINEGVPEMICFAHTYESGLWAPMPKEKPADWATVESPTHEESNPFKDEPGHPLVLAYLAGRKRLREMTAQGFEERHPAVTIFLAEMAKLVLLDAESNEAEELRCQMDVLWDALDEEEQGFVRHWKKRAPAWHPQEEEYPLQARRRVREG